MTFVTVKSTFPVDDRGYVRSSSHGRGNLPIFKFPRGVPSIGDVVRIEFNRDERLYSKYQEAHPNLLPGQFVPRFGRERTVVRVYPALGAIPQGDLYIVLTSGKSTFKSGKYRYSQPPATALKQWSFKAESATGAHWDDLHIFVVPLGGAGEVETDSN